MFVYAARAAMEPARLRLALPDDPALIDRLAAALARQGDPAISVARGRTAVLTFEAKTGDMMLRSRVIQALEDVAGGGWQGLVEPVG
jgi:hypothetical protein